jgi:hypothetical protein
MTIIPSTAITIDGNNAWLVIDGPRPGEYDDRHEVNRPCDTCNGTGAHILDELEDDRSFWKTEDCHACDGTGRHTFTLHVEGERLSIANGRLRRYDGFAIPVHVVEVLPIHDRPNGPQNTDGPMVYLFGSCWWVWRSVGNYEVVTLSEDAAPGMFAVRLAIHKAQA